MAIDERRAEYTRNWKAARPGYQKLYRSGVSREVLYGYILKQEYGMTLEDYYKRLADQGGVCAACGEPPTMTPKRGNRLVVDHDHETGRVRGLVHYRCNTMMTVFDSKHLFSRLMDYKRRNSVATKQLRLARVVQYFQECDIEELRYVHQRMIEILKERQAKVEQADSHNKVKRTRRTKKEIAAAAQASAPDAHDLSVGA